MPLVRPKKILTAWSVKGIVRKDSIKIRRNEACVLPTVENVLKRRR
jgi:hypothetical protein